MHHNVQATAPKDPNGTFRTLVLGRVSTVHQPESNIEASYDYVTPMLKQVYDGPMETKYLGERGSGMLTERATILEAIAVGTRAVGSLHHGGYRPSLPQCAVAVRVYPERRGPRCSRDCPGDQLDTFDENWEVAMGAAALRHSLHIPDTRRRVRRTASYAFQRGGIVRGSGSATANSPRKMRNPANSARRGCALLS